MNNIARTLFVVLILGVSRQNSWALERDALVVVSSKAVVSTETVRLGDIASITDSGNGGLKGSLEQIEIMPAPPPMGRQTLLGREVLQTLKDKGIELDKVGYSIPKKIEIERQGRMLTRSEVVSSARQQLKQDNVMLVKDVVWNSEYAIALGETDIEVERLGGVSRGEMPIRVKVMVDDVVQARFLATAKVDYWRGVPVAVHALERGRLISNEDVRVVRLNLAEEPKDIMLSADDVVGKRVKNAIDIGESIRARNVVIPPVIPRGKSVTILYSKGALVASATGVALEDGFEGTTLKVRNDSSHKILVAEVVDPFNVRVGD